MVELKMEHVLILLIAAFLLYHFVGRCRCNGFSVGGAQCYLHGIKTNQNCWHKLHHPHHNTPPSPPPPPPPPPPPEPGTTPGSWWYDVKNWFHDI